MKKLIFAFLLVSITSLSWGVSPFRIYSQPDVPSTEALDRLNLKLLWRTYIPMDGRKDGFHDVQVLGDQTLVQTQSGLLVLVSNETGEILWKVLLGKPYQVIQEPTYNKNFIFAINENDLFCLDRKTGRLIFRTNLGIGLSAPPSVDNTHIFLCGANKRIYCYLLPMFNDNGIFLGYEKPLEIRGKPKIAIQSEEEIRNKSTSLPEATAPAIVGKGIRSQGPQPFFQWEYKTRLDLTHSLLIAPQFLSAVGIDGDLITLSKTSDILGTTIQLNDGYEVEKEVLAQPIISNDIAYIGAMDATLHAFDLKVGQLLWRFTAGSPITQPPFISGDEIFVSGERNGLAKVSSKDGSGLWNIPSGQRFTHAQVKASRIIAANPKFVYAFDPSGRMVILDRGLGLALTTWDVHDFVFPIVNRSNDRVFLAANNGLLLCMRDRDYPNPVAHLPEKPEPDSPVIPMGEPAEKLLAQLTAKVMEMDSGEKPLAEILEYLGKKYMIKFNLNAKALNDAMLIDVDKKNTKIPETKDMTLSELFRAVLVPLGLTFQPVQDTIVIFPMKKEAANN